MTTEELNEYVFAGIVMKVAWSIRCKRVYRLEDAGEITAEQAQSIPHNVADVKEALQVIRHNKKVVFEVLSELDHAPAVSPAPETEAP